MIGGFGRMSTTGGFGGFYPLPTSMQIDRMLDGAAARVKTAQTTLNKAKKELSAHKDTMKRARYTPEGLKKATAKLKSLEKKVATLTKELSQARKAQLSKG